MNLLLSRVAGLEGSREIHGRYTRRQTIDSAKWKPGERTRRRITHRGEGAAEGGKKNGGENGGERAVKTELWLFARFARLRP
jgi:hypothetical protein